MSLQLFIDLAQANFSSLIIKDISNAADYSVAFSPNGKQSVYAYYFAVKHQDGTLYRYAIGLSNGASPSLPDDELSTTNAFFKAMGTDTILAKGTVSEPTGEVLLPEFKDGIYEFLYGVGPTIGALPVTIAADKTVYVIENSTFDGIAIAGNSVLKTTASGSFTAGKGFIASHESTGIFMLEANLLKDFANAVIKSMETTNEGQYEQISRLLNEFNVAHARTKALVLVDNYTLAVESFNDARAILNHILAIV